MALRTLTIKFGPQNRYSLNMPIEYAANAELVMDIEDIEQVATLQEKAAATQKQFEWMQHAEKKTKNQAG